MMGMPLVDMPLEDLLKYQGRNPKPEDFDEYWDRALSELADINPDIRLEKYSLTSQSAECFDLSFSSVGGERVRAKYVRPRGKKNCPAILQFHGYSWYGGDWSQKLNYVGEGIAIASLDCRGQGGESPDTSSYQGTTHKGQIVRGLEGPADGLYFRKVFLDTAMLARVVANFDEIDPTRLGASGGSQGGGLTLACAALAPIKMSAPVFPFLCDYKRVWEMDLAKDAYSELQYFFKLRDPRHMREDEFFTKLGYIDCQNLAPRIKGEVMLFAGLMDTICPPSTYFAAYNKITSKKQHVIYPDFGHETLVGSDDLIWEFFSSL
jgi:cephalosporin-C deacetylase